MTKTTDMNDQSNKMKNFTSEQRISRASSRALRQFRTIASHDLAPTDEHSKECNWLYLQTKHKVKDPDKKKLLAEWQIDIYKININAYEKNAMPIRRMVIFST